MKSLKKEFKKHLKGDAKDLKDISKDVKHMKKEDALEAKRLHLNKKK